MANFDPTTNAKRDSLYRAYETLGRIKGLYGAAKGVQAILALYIAGTDPAFNAAMNAMFTASERTELTAMATQINALVTDWEANHIAAISS